MQKTLFRFIKQVASLAQKHCAAGLVAISNPTGNGFAGWKHVVLHYLRIEMVKSYAETVDYASEMDRIRRFLNLPMFGFPKPSTLCRSFHRTPMAVLRRLLAGSAELLNQSGHAAVDSTFLTRERAPPHYLRRIDRSVETFKVTFLVDTADHAIIDVGCSTRWPNDAKIGPKLARRNIEALRSLSADKGYDSNSFRTELRDGGVRPLIKHRIYSSLDHAHNTRIDSDSYNRRWMAESVFASIKRTLGATVRACSWWLEFRETLLKATVYNLRRGVRYP